MKFFLIMLFGITLGCSKSPQNNQSPPEDFIQMNLTSLNTIPVEFGSVLYKSSKILTLKFLNDSNESVPALNPQILNVLTSSFSIIYQSNCNTPLAANKVCLMKVSFKNQSTGGLVDASLVLQGYQEPILLRALTEDVFSSYSIEFLVNGTIQQPGIGLYDFGTLGTNDLKTARILVKNKTKSPQTFSGVRLGSTRFKILSESCTGSTLKLNQSCSVTVSISSKELPDGVYSDGENLFIDNLDGRTVNLPLRATVSGSVQSNPIYSLVPIFAGVASPTSIDFGNQSQATTRSIFIKNNGNRPTTDLVFNFSQMASSSFSILFNNCPGQLLPNTSCLVKIALKADSLGAKADTFNIIQPISPGQGVISIPVTGTVVDTLACNFSQPGSVNLRDVAELQGLIPNCSVLSCSGNSTPHPDGLSCDPPNIRTSHFVNFSNPAASDFIYQFSNTDFIAAPNTSGNFSLQSNYARILLTSQGFLSSYQLYFLYSDNGIGQNIVLPRGNYIATVDYEVISNLTPLQPAEFYLVLSFDPVGTSLETMGGAKSLLTSHTDRNVSRRIVSSPFRINDLSSFIRIITGLRNNGGAIQDGLFRQSEIRIYSVEIQPAP
jgi:hypothetical protein